MQLKKYLLELKVKNTVFDPVTSSLLTTCDTNYTNPPDILYNGIFILLSISNILKK